MTLRPPLIELEPVDRAHLESARRIAHEGWGQVHPNPMVGCVLVKGGKVVSQGHHEVFGGPHAEIVALERALSRAEGSTAYVSLEPCNHHGKTPPCAQALIDAGVRRVVFGASDPGPSSGGGAETLRAAGVEIAGVDIANGIRDEEFAEIEASLNEHFVIVFRNQNISPDDQLAFARR